MGIRTKFNEFLYHCFAQIYLPLVKSDVSPAIHLNHMKLPAVFVWRYFIAIGSVARYVNLGGALHSQCLMRPDIVVFLPPQLKFDVRIVDILHNGVLQQFLLHGAVKPLDLSLRLRVLDPPVNR